ncbi:hypothetical protein HJC23_001335 [Cyclotella cryptica]|uniref:Cation-transporting P-type ATPase N-terminal domain-containing protein n=1 Tax=Cyclotella cryptica TaxID=29204 RepID=A0ABD3NWB8_9STRA
MLAIRRVFATAVALGSLASVGVLGSNIDINGSSNAGSLTTVIEFPAIELDSSKIPSISASHQSSEGSWWHALDGIPFLLSRRSKRKLSRKSIVTNEAAVASRRFDLPDVEQQKHRSLAFGDYADPTFNCPATTTCPLVCVNSTDDCPSDATCASANPDVADHEFELCNDGTCADKTLGQACDAELESPCACGGLGFTCAKQIDLYDNCFERFQSFYDTNTECIENEEESLPQVDFNGPAFKACYIPFIIITVLMFLWCAYNQRIAPVEGSNAVLECAIKGKESEKWTQTGYKRTIIGTVLHGLIIIVQLAIQGLLLFLTIQYYVQQEAGPALENLKMIFQDEIQVLMAFQIVWMTGFVWCFLLKYPSSIRSLFYVAAFLPMQHMLRSLRRMKSENADTGLRYKTEYCKVRIDEKTGSRYFYFRMRRYFYDETENKFVPGRLDVTEDSTIGNWLDKDRMHQGLSSQEATRRLGVVGPNVLDLKKPTILGSIVREFSKPFYLYQNFMVWTWAPYWYYYMAIVQTVVRVTGGMVVAIFQYMGDMNLYQLMVVDGMAEVIRDGELMSVDQTDVVPGDIVRVTPGLSYFDMAILKSERLLVDESALTGEVHPVAKIPLDPANSGQVYNTKMCKSSTISAGTTVLECGGGDEYNVLAIVTQTGSFTSKGELLSDVLSYERHQFKFDTEVKLVLFILLVEMAILVSVVLHFIEDHWVYAWFYAVFVAGTCLPPLLPTVFVVSVGISCKRLQAQRITCTDSTGILVAGKVKKAFFDKTGTLTEQGLSFVSARTSNDLGKSATNTSGEVDIDPILQLGLSVCHTLTSNASGDLIGPAVDRMGFSAVRSARLVNEHSVMLGDDTIKYLKRFEFDHHSMTQSVIVQRGEEKIVFVKGSPEAISKLCVPSSIPSDFADHARYCARNGIYQLAIARSTYTGSEETHEVQRSDIENDLTFTGCINFQNTMKHETPSVISELREGNVESAIVTGDNVLTGIYIAKKSGIIAPNKNVIIGISVSDDEVIQWVHASDDSDAGDPLVSIPENTVLAMTGEVWNHLLRYDPKSAIALGNHTFVYGRCTPNDKVSVVSTFVQYGDITLMCGDGGNDCGALKAAHVGIALSDAEASVVAPFTSLDKNITSVTEVLKEGRCALASAFASYKYMLMYGQVESINQVVNAYFSITFSEWCWVFMDGIWPITMAFSLPLSKAAKTLSPKRPTASILGPHTLSSACGVLSINFLFLVIALALLWKQDWFQCRMWGSNDVSNVTVLGDNYETSVIFLVTGYQYISSAAAFNFGYTYRAGWFKNYVFVFFFSVWTAFQFTATMSANKFSCIWRANCDNDNAVRFVTSTEPEALYNDFNTTVMPTSFRGTLLGLMIANLILNCAWEYLVVNRMLPKVNDEIAGIKSSQHASGEYVDTATNAYLIKPIPADSEVA